MIDLRFDHPEWLLLALLAVPLAIAAWSALSSMDRFRRGTAIALRCLLMLAIAVALAGPHTVRTHDDVTVIGIIDVSGSVRRFASLPDTGALDAERATSTIQSLRAWFREATQSRRDGDRFGLVVFDGEATVLSAPTRGAYVDDNIDLVRLEGTNIAEGIRLALAMLPPDTARRIVLMTDGNETAGSALEAARRAAGATAINAAFAHAGATGVPIDVVPIAYHVSGDVQVVRVETPPFARPGERITARIVLEATHPTQGRLSLMREGAPVPIGAGGETARRVMLQTGQTVELAIVELGDTPVNRFEAVFEPADPRDDLLSLNNRSEAFTITPAKGAALMLQQENAGPSALAILLRESDMRVEEITGESLPRDLLAMQNYDLVILNNVPAYDLAPQQQDMLASFVTDLGGGLLMVGGEDSFGAGGWAGTPIEAVLPLEMSPPKEMILPSAALVLVLDKSGSMQDPVWGARASQQEVANEGAALAIESMRADSLIGVVTFDFVPHEFIPLQRNTDAKRLGELVRTIQPDGGTDIEPALRMAYNMLRETEVERRHIVLLTDGRAPSANLEQLATMMAAQGIRLSTIAVGEDTDAALLKKLAEIGQGEFYPVRNPRTLPRILVDAVQVVNKPLIKESVFTPVVQPSGAALGIAAAEAPDLTGLVITGVKPSPLVSMELTHPEGDPLLAVWQTGLGRTAAFTSDAEGRWSARWKDWAGDRAFWTQLVQSIARPPGEPDAELLIAADDDSMRITLDMSASSAPTNAYMQVDGTVYTPDGETRNVRLRQTGPGLFEGEAPADSAGSYIVVVNPRRGERRLAPLIGGVTRATGAEYRRYRSNIALLNDLVEVTGGRRLAIEAPEEASLFDPEQLPRSISFRPAWPMVIWAALALLLLDVACRRIAWRTSHLTSLALAVVRRAPRRGHESRQTLATLRTSGQLPRPERVNGGIASQDAATSVPPREAPLHAPITWRTPAVTEAEDAGERAGANVPKRAPTAEEIQRAIDALRRPSEETKQQPKERASEVDRPPSDGPGQPSEDTRERLRRAKRRARGDEGT